VAEDKRPLDLALDVFVYVPVGLVVSAKELLPTLVERGRERLGSRVANARIVGQFAVQQGQAQAGKAFARTRAEAMSRVDDVTEAAAGTSPVVADEVEAEAAPPRPPGPTSGPDAEALAIPGYDSLSASQVLPRLAGLASDELEAVRRYEVDHRSRKTILGRVAQLQAAAPTTP
jgi:hypothetical protein